MSICHADQRYIALSGGIGGAKLAVGLADTLAPEQLLVIANTGDDFSFLDLEISPDIDTLLYTLSGCADDERGWGRRDETWHCRAVLAALGGPTWFQLGDTDLALHLLRTSWLREGHALEWVTDRLGQRLGVKTRIAPMTNDPVRTWLRCIEGTYEFQYYFVLQQCRPTVQSVEYRGTQSATLSTAFHEGLKDPALTAVFICPSNPFLSIGPILSLQGLRERLRRIDAPVIAVSPLIGGKAVKGPTAKIMQELGFAPTAQSILDIYKGIIDALIIHESDELPEVNSEDVWIVRDDILLRSKADRERIAKRCINLADQLIAQRSRKTAS